MAGLSVLLEAQDNFPKRPQIISKTAVLKKPSLSSPPSPPLSPSLPASPFLEHCYLCRKRLVEGKDIYMYRGDRAFCSVMCRCRHMHMDQAAAAASAASSGESQLGRRRERVAGKGRALAC